MTPEIRRTLDSYYSSLASQGRTGDFLRKAIALLSAQTETLSADEITAAIRAEAAKVCDDEAHIDQTLAEFG